MNSFIGHLNYLISRTFIFALNLMPKNGGTNYIGPCCILVALGSIPDLPADSCNEIKANEGQSVSSGKYWMQVKSASFSKVALTYCDMVTGGEYSKKNLRRDVYI